MRQFESLALPVVPVARRDVVDRRNIRERGEKQQLRRRIAW
jgi:hypothetical protein